MEKKVVVGWGQKVRSSVSVHGSPLVLADHYGLLDPSGSAVSFKSNNPQPIPVNDVVLPCCMICDGGLVLLFICSFLTFQDYRVFCSVTVFYAGNSWISMKFRTMSQLGLLKFLGQYARNGKIVAIIFSFFGGGVLYGGICILLMHFTFVHYYFVSDSVQ